MEEKYKKQTLAQDNWRSYFENRKWPLVSFPVVLPLLCGRAVIDIVADPGRSLSGDPNSNKTEFQSRGTVAVVVRPRPAEMTELRHRGRDAEITSQPPEDKVALAEPLGSHANASSAASCCKDPCNVTVALSSVRARLGFSITCLRWSRM